MLLIETWYSFQNTVGMYQICTVPEQNSPYVIHTLNAEGKKSKPYIGKFFLFVPIWNMSKIIYVDMSNKNKSFVLILTYFINLNAFLASRQQWRSFCVLTGTSNLYSHKEWQRKIRDQFSKVVPNRLQIWRSPWQIDQRKMFEMGHNLQDHSLFLEFSWIMVVHYGRIGHL